MLYSSSNEGDSETDTTKKNGKGAHDKWWEVKETNERRQLRQNQKKKDSARDRKKRGRGGERRR